MASGSSSGSGSPAQTDVHSSSAAASADVLPHDQAAKAKPKKHRFSVADDAAILREIPGHSRPFKYGSKAWDEIAEKLSGQLHGVKARTIRERTILLVKLHIQGQATSAKQQVHKPILNEGFPPKAHLFLYLCCLARFRSLRSGTAEEYTERTVCWMVSWSYTRTRKRRRLQRAN